MSVMKFLLSVFGLVMFLAVGWAGIVFLFAATGGM
jgi:hypothetical protein